MDRSQTKTDGEVQETVAVPSTEESEQIFGFPLAAKYIQPVWLEVENNSDTAFFLEEPGFKADHHQLDPYTLYAEKDMIDLDGRSAGGFCVHRGADCSR